MPQHADTNSRIAHVLASCLGVNISAPDLHDVQRLDEIVPFDSLSTLEFAMGLEREFGFRLERERMSPDFLFDHRALATYLEAVNQEKAV